MYHTIMYRSINWALFNRIMTTIFMGMVVNLMNILANNIFGFQPKHSGTDWINKGA